MRGSWFQMQQRFFEILAKQYPNKILFVPNLGILLFFCKILLSDKFDGADFKYKKSF